MPAPVVAGLMAILAATAGWLIANGIKALIVMIFGFLMYRYDFGWQLFLDWLNGTRWSNLVEWLAMPDVPGDWTTWFAAANAWAPIAEVYRLLKAFYSLKVATIALNAMMRIFK